MSWDEVKKVNSNLAKPLDTLIAEKHSKTDTLINSVKTIANNIFDKGISSLKSGSVPIIKSIQRGVFETDYRSDRDDKNVTISQVNINKSILLFHTVTQEDYSKEGVIPPNAYFINSTTISFSYNYVISNYYWSYRWEVIEFY